jgi:hypothetical protein
MDEIVNENFEEELRQTQLNYTPPLRSPSIQQDMVYYYVTTVVVTINTSMQGVPTGRRMPPTVNTHYAFDEAELIRDRQSRISIATGNNAFSLTRRGNEDVVIITINTSQTEHRFSDIQTRRLPLGRLRPSASRPVVTMHGPF